VLRSLILFGLFLLPAVVAAIGAVRRSGPLLIAGGVLALGQSFIAFSGVTIPYIVPAILLIALGVAGSGTTPPRRAIVGALAVVLLGIAAWVLPLALSETSCWIARSGPDGTIVYSAVPETDTFTLGSGELAAGCDGGAMTAQGAALAIVLAVGAVGMAVLASTPAATANQGLTAAVDLFAEGPEDLELDAVLGAPCRPFHQDQIVEGGDMDGRTVDRRRHGMDE
jgi:hypothetical protein